MNRLNRRLRIGLGRLAIWGLLAVLAGIVLSAPFNGRQALAAQQGCDEVPASFAGRDNPTPELDTRRLRYWGKQFKAKCARCHGEDGGGGGEDAAKQAVPPANFTDRAYMAQCSDVQLFYQIMFGGEQKSAMPAFGPRSDQGWSEAKVWEMVAYVRSFAR